MPHKARAEHWEPLKYVTTLAGAARLVQRDRKTITYAIDAGNVAAIRDGKTVLVSIPSLMAYYNRR